ncbi:SRPBCC family protein [Mycobacterium sp. MYCO198283]|uniref:type II toxin-antitoxin system Rv0910 family toxin n=1 Tax=Mycobacterium sp. MYCO198283 TaxID=2883505 RepID=UPI001E54873C|nr:SRPBCC family protein [Mycobacterium sp. MYCO198283]MCG5433284.1 SRPBCC family protein [Mycobacterium sp. MYCO198283]
MAKVELSRELAIDPQTAWERASDLHALGDWLVMHEGWRGELPDQIGVGTTIVGVAGAKGMRNRVTWTVQQWDPPRLLDVTGKGVGGTKYGLRMQVKPTATGSAFSVRLDLGGAPLFGPIGAAAARAVKGDIDRSIRRFEELYVG